MKNRKHDFRKCPACAGTGTVCCRTWAEIRAGDCDLEFSGVGVPLWPNSQHLEMPYCPFCGQRFEPSAKKVK